MTLAQVLSRFSRTQLTTAIGVLALLASGSIDQSAPKTASRGMHFQPEKALTVEPMGSAAETFNTQQARPVSMVSADFDVDGVKDLAVGYDANKGGEIAIMRGNLDAIAPQNKESWTNAGFGRYAAAFLPQATIISVPVAPDLLVAADVSGDGYLDLVFAAKNGNALYVLAGNGKGQFTLERPVSVTGAITALSAYEPGDNNTADALVVGVKASNGFMANLYRKQPGGFVFDASYKMPGAVTAIDTANLDSDLTPDAAIVAGGEVVVVHGAGALVGKAHVETLPIYDAVSLTAGSFLFDRHAGLQLAVLTSDGTVHFLAHQGFDPRPFAKQEISEARRNAIRHDNGATLAETAGNTGNATWTEVETLGGVAPTAITGNVPILLRGRTAGNGQDDVLAVNGSQQEIAVVRHPVNSDEAMPANSGVVTRSPLSSSDMVAAVAQRLGPVGGEGIVFLRKGSMSPEITTPAQGNTMFVNTTVDSLDANDTARCTSGSGETCSLRDAITYANADASVNILGGTSDTIMIPSGAYNLTYQAGTTDVNNNAVTHLEILGPMTLVGDTSGSGVTISAQSNDVVFTINPGAYGSYNATGDSYVFDTTLENLTITGGLNINNPANSLTGLPNNVGGAINWDADGTGNLTLTDCTVTANTNDWGDGGGIWFYNSQGGGSGTLTFSGGNVSSNATSEIGGGIYQAAAPAGFSATNVAFANNTASPSVNTSDPGGASGADDGGGIYLSAVVSGSGTPSANISGGSITGNSADGDGGGIYTTQGISIAGGTNISSNNATGAGGGIFHNADATTTVSAANITSNSAANTGGGITVGTELAANGNAFTIANSRIFGNTSTNGASGLSAGEPSSTGAGAVTATENWWGCNAGPTTAADGCDQAVLYDSANGSMSAAPNIVLTIGASPNSVSLGTAIGLTAAVNTDSSSGTVPGGPGALEGLPISFSATVGSFSASPTGTIDSTGQATASITPTGTGTGSASATLDNQTVSTSVTVNSGPATHFVITGPNPFPFYTATGITVTAYDATNNVATSYDGTVAFTSDDPGFFNPGNLTLANGVGVTTIGFKTAGTDSVTATDTVNSSITGTTYFTVPPGATSQLIVSVPSSTDAGATFSFTVGAYDFYGNLTPSYTGTVAFTSTDPAAALPANYTFVATDNGQHTFVATLNTAGNETITATDSVNVISGVSGGIAVTIPSFVVNSATDDATGNASNCNTTPEGTCTLRDALAAATAAGSGNIKFDPTVFAASNTAAENTITLSSGLALTSDTTIAGPTTASGANLVTINGGGSSSNFPIFSTPSSALQMVIQNLTITGGNNGSATTGTIDNGYAASLTIQNSTISGNSASTGAGGVFNDYNASLTLIDSTISGNTGLYGAIVNESGATVTVTDSTITGNSSTGNGGGGILSGGTAAVTNSTITGNSATSGGGIFNSGGTLTLAGSIVAGNTASSSDPDVEGTATDGGYNLIGDGTGLTGITNGVNGSQVGTAASPLNPLLTVLGNYGGSTETLLPLPGSPAVCAISPSSAAGTDQRGMPRTTTYGAVTCQDIGAVETNYALSFTTNPAATENTGVAFPAAVTLTESGSPVSGVAIAVTLNGGGTLAGSPVSSTTSANGVASYTLTVSNPTALSNLTLTATLPSPPSVTATSSDFALSELVPAVTALSPSSGPAAGGTTVVISGINFSGATAVKFGATLAASYAVTSSTSISATSPSGSGTVDVAVTTPDGTSPTNAADQFTYFAISLTANSISATAGAAFNGALANFSINAGDTAPLSDFTASINWGDGTPVTAGTITQPGGAGTQYVVSGAHTYVTTGSYSFTVNVNGGQYGSASGTGTATVNPGPASHFLIGAPASTIAGKSFNFTITALDANNNTATGYNGTVAFSTTDPGHDLNVPLMLTNGVGTSQATLDTRGTQTITATDTANSALSGTSAPITVFGGSATYFAVTTPATAVAGTSFGFTVTGYDVFSNQADEYRGTIHFTSSDGSVSLPSDYTFTASDSGTHAFNATLNTPGNQTITVHDTASSQYTGTSSSISVSVQNFVVENTNDSGTGSLRAALSNAATAGSGNITFDPAVFTASNTAAENTITLSSGLTIPSNTTITGATSGNGATLTNLVTIDGGGSSSNFSMFTVNSGVTAGISSLILTNGYTQAQGGAILNNGTLSIANCALTNNYAAGYISGGGNGGGAILNQGTLTITGSTFSGNAAAPGGAISIVAGGMTVSSSTFTGNTALSGYAGGAVFLNTNTNLTITNSTFTGNSASSGEAGGIGSYGTVTALDSILSGNTNGDCISAGPSPCPANGSNGNVIGVSGIALSPLGDYGGPTQTVLPMPGSPAICVISPSTASGTDQRGMPRTTTYGSTVCQDSGAAQTNYSISFTTNPPTNVAVSTNFDSAVTLDESGSPVNLSGVTIPLALNASAGTLNGGSASTTNGVATYSTLQVNAAGNNDTLTANLQITAASAAAQASVNATSSQFNIIGAPVLAMAFSPNTIQVNGTSTLTFTITDPSSTTAQTGVAFADALPAGVVVASPNGLTSTCGGTFTATVGSSALSLSGAALAANASCSISVSVTASAPGDYTNVSGPVTSTNGGTGNSATASLTVNQGSSTTVASNASATYSSTSQSVTLKATVTSAAGTVNGGTVTFTVLNGATPIGAPAIGTVSNGAASASYTLPGSTSPGNYTLSAAYSGTSQFQSSSDSTHLLIIGSALSTTSASNATATFSTSTQSVTLAATVTSGGGTVNSGTVTFTVLNGSSPVGAATTSGTVSSGAASVSYSLPAGTLSGSYVIQTAYSGSTDFQGSSDNTHKLTINGGTTTTAAANASATFSTSNQPVALSATVTSSAGTVNSGTVTFAIMQGGTQIGLTTAPANVTNGSATATYALPGGTNAGTYTIVASFAGAGGFTSSTDSTHMLTIVQASATVQLSGLTQTYTGSPIMVTATTTPPGLTVNITYSGSATAPTKAGSYQVVGTVLNANYTGSATGTLKITQAMPTITWPAPSAITYGIALSATQLDATATYNNATVAGTFVYTPVAGTVLGAGSHTLSVSFTPSDTVDFSTPGAVTATIMVNMATLDVIANNANKVYGSANPVFTGKVTGSQNSDSFTETFATTATISSNVGSYAIVPSVTGADLSDYTEVVTDGTLTITQAASSISLTASATSITPGESLTLTATVVSSTIGTPTGTVTFYDGTTPLGTVQLQSATAIFTTSSLAPGVTHSISAIYSGDINFTGSTTTADLSVTVAPLEFTLTVNSATIQSVYPGGTATYTFQVAPLYGSYAGTMNFAVSGLPATATATFSPDSIPANGGTKLVTLTISDAALSSAASPPTGLPKPFVPIALGILLLPLARAKRLRNHGRKMLWVLVLAVSALSATMLSGCGSGNGFFAQGQKDYHLTITATAGTVQKSAAVTLNVQ